MSQTDGPNIFLHHNSHQDAIAVAGAQYKEAVEGKGFHKEGFTYRHKRRRFPELYRRNAPTGYWGSDTENTKYHTVMFYETTKLDTSLRLNIYILRSLIFSNFGVVLRLICLVQQQKLLPMAPLSTGRQLKI